MLSIRRLTKKAKAVGATQEHNEENSTREALLREAVRSPPMSSSCTPSPSKNIPTGFFAMYVGEEKERFVVPTSFLSHPLFKILLERAYEEFGFEQKSGLVVPCSVSTFQEVVEAVEGSHGRFDITKLFQEFV